MADPLSDPSWLPHRLDPDSRTIRYLLVPREDRARVPFLTDEWLGERPMHIAPLPAEAPRPHGLAFIFHSAFCCSTLVANLLDAPGRASAVKEPVILNDIVGWRARGGEAGALRHALAVALTALSRPFAPGEITILKPSNLVNPLLPTIAALAPEAPILLLHAPLPVFLKSILSKGLWGRLWVRELAWKLRRDRLLDFGFHEESFFRLTDLQTAAIGWLAQQQLFAEASRRLGQRVRTLDSETFLDHPATALLALFQHFGMDADADTARRIASGPALARDAKTGASFDREARNTIHAAPAAANSDELEKVEAWARTVADQSGIPLALGAALVGP